MRYESYQIPLILLGLLATVFFGIFFWREVSPEYKIYQNDYAALEKFRSSYTGEPPPDFKAGIKQIVLEREDKGPPRIDRCTSCHVALQFPHFSPTKLAQDINGNTILNEEGIPVKVPNPDYIWSKLDAKIRELKDEKVNAQLESQGEASAVRKRLKEAKEYEALKTAEVGEQVYDVSKVLRMHPLMGKETRAFEFHPIEEYGCTSCHNGNGRGLTTEKAHGPVFDGTYNVEFIGYTPRFLEPDTKNDPMFSKVFNHKPGHELLFQTEPIYVGKLIEAKCMQCHQSSQAALMDAVKKAIDVTKGKSELSKGVENALQNEKGALVELLKVRDAIQSKGLADTIHNLEKGAQNYSIPEKQRKENAARLEYLRSAAGLRKDQEIPQTPQVESRVLQAINTQLIQMVGSGNLVQELEKSVQANPQETASAVQKFIEAHQKDKQADGSLFTKLAYLNFEKEMLKHVQDTESSFSQTLDDQSTISSIKSDVDLLTKGYHRGQNLYISQACYACHRIAGVARGGVGPELTNEGKSYPWFVKQSIVWPQADLKTSTMPNFHLDHEDLEPLLTYVLAQTGENKSVSPTAYKTAIQEWEAGSRMPWEKPVTPVQMHDLRYAMTVFATQGCAACHRLKGYESNVGFRVEKEKGGKIDFETLYKEKEWFRRMFPEMILGSDLVRALEDHAQEIDQHLADDVRTGSILEEIDRSSPETIESFYSNFRYADRAKNYAIKTQMDNEADLKKKSEIADALKAWKERVHLVLMMYIQEYGLGRLIGPRPNWAGVYRSDEWLMEHFHKPTAHVARSIMPVLPFDDTKFYALTYMLDTLGKRNRDELRTVWQNRGFSPELAFQTYCSQCHGEFLAGNGPISEWIYPIPKNLRNSSFLRNLTKARVINSIRHGVKGTPMPPWGEVGEKPTADGIPVISDQEINRLADWLFSNLPGQTVIKGSEDVPKWQYKPEDVIDELRREGHKLPSKPSVESPAEGSAKDGANPDLSFLPRGEEYFAALEPKVIKKTENNPEILELFDKVPSPQLGPDQFFYYVRQKYFTPENIETGKAFFELNCAVCHGAEGDGSGIRAEVMQDAKPRMLTNLDWLESRDDLRLLRSIKYGVPGTAMTPWGDLTSSLQRLQLVIFIRSLSKTSLLREELTENLYKSFGYGDVFIQDSRVKEYGAIERIKSELRAAQSEQTTLADKVKMGLSSPEEASNAYKKALELAAKLQMHQAADQLLLSLKEELNKENKILEDLGFRIIDKDLTPEIFKNYLEAMSLEEERYHLKGGRLYLANDPAKEEKAKIIGQKIVQEIDRKLNEFVEQKKVVEGKISSTEKTQELTALNNEISSLTKLKNQTISAFQESERSRQKQLEIYDKFLKKMKELDAQPNDKT